VVCLLQTVVIWKARGLLWLSIIGDVDHRSHPCDIDMWYLMTYLTMTNILREMCNLRAGKNNLVRFGKCTAGMKYSVQSIVYLHIWHNSSKLCNFIYHYYYYYSVSALCNSYYLKHIKCFSVIVTLFSVTQMFFGPGKGPKSLRQLLLFLGLLLPFSKNA